MELHKALRDIIDTEGEDIVADMRLMGMLADLQAAADNPAARYILRAIIADGYAARLLRIGEWNDEAKSLASYFASITGFVPAATERVFQSLAYGLKWLKRMPKAAPSAPSAPSAPTPPPVTPNRRKPWSKLTVDEREAWLNSLVEIRQPSCGLTIDSVYIADSSYDDTVTFYINFEISGKISKKFEWVNAAYAIYDSKNRLRVRGALISSLNGGKSYNIIDSSPESLNFKYYDIGKILIFIDE